MVNRGRNGKPLTWSERRAIVQDFRPRVKVLILHFMKTVILYGIFSHLLCYDYYFNRLLFCSTVMLSLMLTSVGC